MAYYQAVDRFWSGVSPYQDGAYWNFIYPPGFLILFNWLKFIPPGLLVYLWPALSLVCLWWVIIVLLPKTRFYLKGIVFLFFMNWFPVKFSLGMGQINLIVLVLFICFYLLMIKKKELGAGLVLGALVTIKITPLLVIIWLVKLKKWRVIGWSFLSILLVNLMAGIKLPLTVWGQFLLVTKGGLVASSTYYFNQSWVAMLDRLFAFSNGELLARAVVTVVFIATVYQLKKFSERNFCLVLLLVTMVSPVTWQHHLVGLIPAIIYLFKVGKRYLLILMGALLTGINIVNPAQWESIAPVYSHAGVGALILFFLLLKVGDKADFPRQRE